MVLQNGVLRTAGETTSTSTGNVLSGSGMQINAPIASISQYFGGKPGPRLRKR